MIVDMHCDTIYELRQLQKAGKDYSLRENLLHIDLQKMKKGEYLLQNFAMYVNMSKEKPLEEALHLIDIFYQEMEKNQDLIAPVRTYSDIEENRKAGRMSALLTLEEGEICQGDPAILHILYRLGARMMTLTWNFENSLAYPNKFPPEKTQDARCLPDMEHGVKEAGIRILEEMEKIGMIIDVSHLSDAGFLDVAKYTTKPFVASHSNARALCGHCRNLTDDMIRILAERGGVMGLNFCPDFVNEKKDGKDAVCTIEGLVRHAKHIVNVGGMECLGLGTDYDGISGELELKDCSFMPILYDALLKNGFNQDQADAIFEGNVLRVYQELLR